MFAFTSTETSEGGRLTKQFLSDCCRATSACTVLPAGFFGGMMAGRGECKRQLLLVLLVLLSPAARSSPAITWTEVVGAVAGPQRGGRTVANRPAALETRARAWARARRLQRAQPQNCSCDSSPPLPCLCLLYKVHDAMALLSTRAPVNYDEQEGLLTCAQTSTEAR